MDRVETTNVDISNTVLVVEEMIEFGRQEAEALSSADVTEAHVLADLHARLASIALHDIHGVADNRRNLRMHLQGAGTHPLGPRLMMSYAISKNSVELLEEAHQSALESMTGDARTQFLRDVVEAWLYRFGDPLQSLDVARVAVEGLPEELPDGAPDGGPEWGFEAIMAHDLRYLQMIALGAAGEWRVVADTLTRAASNPNAGLHVIAEAIHVLFDRMDDVEGAAQLIVRVAERLVGPNASDGVLAIHHFRALSLALEVAFALDDTTILDPETLYRTLVAMLDDTEGAERATSAVRYLIAERAGREEAVEILASLISARSEEHMWGATLAAMTQCQVAGALSDWAQFVFALRSLAESGDAGALTGAYVWRAAEIADARMDRLPESVRLWRAVLSDGSQSDESRRAIERLLLTENPVILIGHLKGLSGTDHERAWSLRRAAAVAESRASNVDQAVALLTLSLETSADLSTYRHLIRLYRQKQDRDALIGLLHQLIDAVDELRTSSVYMCLLGVLQIESGDIDGAESSFASAARHAPLDPMSRIALARLYRSRGKQQELLSTLEELGTLVTNPNFRARFLRELGLLQAHEFENPSRARQSLESALEIEPNHPATLHALAQLHDVIEDWEHSIELRNRAIDALSGVDPMDMPEVSRLTLYMEIGEIYEQHKSDHDTALRMYESAFGEDDTSILSLHAQARILRMQQSTGPLLDVLRFELQLGVSRARQLEIQLEIADLVIDGSRDSDASLNAYQEVLQVDPGNESALAGVLRIGRDKARWDIISQAYASAPRTPENLEILAEAYKKQSDWAGLALIREKQLESLTTPAEQASVAHELAGIYHRRLGRVDDAISAYKRAISFDVNPSESRRGLARMLEEGHRWSELVQLYDEELANTPPEQTERHLNLLMRLGGLRRQQLGSVEETADTFEAVLKLDPEHVGALEALTELYTELKDDKKLLVVLEARAQAAEDMIERCSIMTQTAEIAQRKGDNDGAMLAYQRAFESNPGNRAVFTAMEKLCYKSERWDDAMWLYQKAIDLVEAGQCRAYRLGDLYARRGQVQLQYLKLLDAAAESYQHVIELDPNNDTALKFLESIHSQGSNWAGLIAAYEKRAKLLSDSQKRRETLRRAARVAGNKLKDPVEAARIYELLLESDPTDDEALNTLERFYERSKKWSSLIGVLQKRLQSTAAGETTTTLLRRIAKISEEGLLDSEQALIHYRRILDIAPGNRDSLDALARIYESTEQWAEFVDTVRKQIRVTTDRHVKALLYFKCGSVMEAKFSKEEDAIRYYDAAIKTSPSCLPAVHGLRDLYLRREDWPRVIQTLELEVKLWQDDKERAGVFAQIGRIYANNLDQSERALHYYESALAVDPDCAPANKALFEHHFDRGEWTRAQKLVQKLAQKVMREGDPSARSEFYRKCGIVSQMTGDPRSGAETLIIALEIKPTNLDALDALVELARSHPSAYDDWESTLRELEKVYKKRDDSDTHLARVRVAQAMLLAREGELEQAEALYTKATALCPGDLKILNALIELHLGMRRWTNAHTAITKFIESEPRPSKDVLVEALLKQAEIYADYEMDPQRASTVLQKVIALRPDHQEAHYRLAQELYMLGNFPRARASIDRVIELAAAPGMPLSPQALARYYYYRGRIIDASGDARAATSQYRRAVEYDPGYSPPALALARRAADSGDQGQAENLLINAAHAAMQQGGARAAVPLQRGLARILLSSGDRSAAIEAYRGILNVSADSAMDRVALAEIYAVEDIPKAISELRKVINRDIYHSPAYRMLAAMYTRLGEHQRALRSLSVMEMLGFAEDADRAAASQSRNAQMPRPIIRQLDENLRRQLMLTEAATGALGEIFNEISYEVSNLFPAPSMGEQLAPFKSVGSPQQKMELDSVAALFGVEPEVYVGVNVPGDVVLISYPRQIAVFDQGLLSEKPLAWRCLFGWAFEAIRGRYAILFSLGRRHRDELGSLLRSLLLPETNRTKPTVDFMRNLPPRAIQTIERCAGALVDTDIDTWIDDMLSLAKRAGLFTCNDFGVTTRMIARLSGESPSSDQDILALGSVLGGPDLVRFYLSDEYHKLHELLSSPMSSM